jgi:hypothetical protein
MTQSIQQKGIKMKKTLVLTTIALLVSGSAAAKTWVLTNAERAWIKETGRSAAIS